jgi:hypothetical protein
VVLVRWALVAVAGRELVRCEPPHRRLKLPPLERMPGATPVRVTGTYRSRRPETPARRRLSWAALLHRVFFIDAHHCLRLAGDEGDSARPGGSEEAARPPP